MAPGDDANDIPAVRDHRRQWRDCLYVYPVVSRRSGGLSVGVNLNPDKRCNFACVYCQIDRCVPRGADRVDLHALRDELRGVLREAAGGEIWSHPRFASTPHALRRVNDIAFSGDGEPTCLPQFDRAVAVAAEVKAEMRLPGVKIVVITNASQFGRPQFRRALPILDAHNGEIWAKLDAGTEAFFARVNRPRPRIGLRRIVENITSVARGRPVVIQSLFLRIDGRPPPPEEIDAYAARLREILAAGGRIKLVQAHTIARPPTEPFAAALTEAELEAVAARVRAAVPGVAVEVYPGQDVAPQGATRPSPG